MSEHPRRRRLAVGAGNRRDRDSARRIRGKQHVDHRSGHISRRAFTGRHVHAKAGAGIDFQDTNSPADRKLLECRRSEFGDQQIALPMASTAITNLLNQICHFFFSEEIGLR